MSKPELRPASPQDRQALLQLYAAIHQGYKDADAAFDYLSTEEFIANNSIVVAVIGKQIVGFCTYIVFSPFFNKHVKHATAITLWVDPKIRGRGVGKKLLAYCEARIKQLNCKKLIIEIHHTQTAEGGFFEKTGFKLMDKVYIKGMV